LTYFIISASVGVQWTISAPNGRYSASRISAVRRSVVPSTVIHGRAKSCALLTWRRNSGFIATPKSTSACLPEARSRIGVIRASVVVGGTVLLRPGNNQISIANLAPGAFNLPPFFMLDYADVGYTTP